MKYCPNPDCPGRPEPGVRPEFVDEADVCSDCGTPLVYQAVASPGESTARASEPAPGDPFMEEPESTDEEATPVAEAEGGSWVAVEVDLLPQEAHIVRGLLEANGIAAELRDENTIAATLLLNAFRGVKVVVKEADFERAQKLLASIEDESRRAPAASEEDGSVAESSKE